MLRPNADRRFLENDAALEMIDSWLSSPLLYWMLVGFLVLGPSHELPAQELPAHEASIGELDWVVIPTSLGASGDLGTPREPKPRTESPTRWHAVMPEPWNADPDRRKGARNHWDDDPDGPEPSTQRKTSKRFRFGHERVRQLSAVRS